MDIASLGPVDEEEPGGHERHGDSEGGRQWFVENKATRGYAKKRRQEGEDR
jgi:hypothetical protein